MTGFIITLTTEKRAERKLKSRAVMRNSRVGTHKAALIKFLRRALLASSRASDDSIFPEATFVAEICPSQPVATG